MCVFCEAEERRLFPCSSVETPSRLDSFATRASVWPLPLSVLTFMAGRDLRQRHGDRLTRMSGDRNDHRLFKANALALCLGRFGKLYTESNIRMLKKSVFTEPKASFI